eukprot:TRINITY_DN23127_c0_g1_i1.p1 TRINITY_DN23127_c0_g1~~TRINITY_DN23127_c0_g1_i1.p1  ORF type:complete len:354 (+),score=63.10 TRINITY_DN23127_c0_g1_i1:107-1168(+)
MALLGALGHLANLGQFVEIGQGHVHQREQVRWSQRNYKLDAQALKIDLLGAARDDVRGTYDTFIERLDTLLLLNALLLPFALNTLQFSGDFIPHTETTCELPDDDCLEVRHAWLVTVWVYLVGASLIMPFWSLLLLLRCKIQLDDWLSNTLEQLQEIRREIIAIDMPSMEGRGNSMDNAAERCAELQEEIVKKLGSFIVDYQDLFNDLWEGRCASLMYYATRMLIWSTIVAVALVGFMFWLYLSNRRGDDMLHSNRHFAVLMVAALLIPGITFLWQRYSGRQPSSSAMNQQFGGLGRRRGPTPFANIAHASSTRSLPLMRRPGDQSPHATTGAAPLLRSQTVPLPRQTSMRDH